MAAMQVLWEQQQQKWWLLSIQSFCYIYFLFMTCPLSFFNFCVMVFLQVEGGWILEGQKRWIGNSTFAEVLVIFARNTSTNQVNGYVREQTWVPLSSTIQTIICIEIWTCNRLWFLPNMNEISTCFKNFDVIHVIDLEYEKILKPLKSSSFYPLRYGVECMFHLL